VKGMVVDRVVAGKMVDSRILMDGLGMMTQLGVIPAEKAVGSECVFAIFRIISLIKQ
jgi:hypothetical protein